VLTLVLVLLLIAVVGLAVAATVGVLRGGLPQPASDVPPPLDGPVSHPVDLDRARFQLAFRGYRMDQVDRILDDARDAMAARDQEIARLEALLAEADGSPGPQGEPARDEDLFRRPGAGEEQAEPVADGDLRPDADLRPDTDLRPDADRPDADEPDAAGADLIAEGAPAEGTPAEDVPGDAPSGQASADPGPRGASRWRTASSPAPSATDGGRVPGREFRSVPVADGANGARGTDGPRVATTDGAGAPLDEDARSR
jgi:DivIVA domain-containing protein